MNKTIVVGTTKGGGGKSTFVMSLSAFASSVLAFDVIIVDGDPTGVVSYWARKRADPKIKVKHLPSNQDISQEMQSLRASNPNSLLIVDSGGFDNLSMRTAMSSSETDLVVIPSKCSAVDLFAMRPFVIEAANHLAGSGTTVVGCFMENDALPSKASKILEAKKAMSGFGIKVLDNYTVKRDAYRDNYLKGGDALSDPKARKELEAIYNEIKEVLK